METNMAIEGYRGVKDYRYTELNSGVIKFDVDGRPMHDQKGRAIGYSWKIYNVVVELLSDEEYRGRSCCVVIKDGSPTEYIEARCHTTRDGNAYGSTAPRMVFKTEDEAYKAIMKRAERACKTSAKKFVAFNKGGHA
jgi:hypothetical protein